MAKYLFLLGMYYPRSSANGVCCKNLVDALVNAGHEVTCIVNDDITRSKDEYIDGAHILRIKARLHYRMLEWCYYHPDSKFNKVISTFANIINKAQLFVMSSRWPRISPSYTKRFYKMAVSEHAKKKFDAVIAVYTPVDTLYAGYLLKKRCPGIKFIPYYLDALAGGWGPTKWTKEKINKRTRLLEQKIDAMADIVVSMKSSESYHRMFPLSGTDDRRVFLDVPTFVGIEDTGKSTKNKGNGKITVLYSGSIHFPDRNPLSLLKHFAIICNKSNVELLFMGSNNCQYIFDEYSQLSNGKIRTIGQFSHSEAIQKLRNADILLNIGSTNPNTVTCKIFEYMQFRKPIISTFSIENEPSIPYLEKYGNYFLLDERPESDFQKINDKLLAFLLSEKTVEYKNYESIFYLNTPKAFIDVLNKLC